MTEEDVDCLNQIQRNTINLVPQIRHVIWMSTSVMFVNENENENENE